MNEQDDLYTVLNRLRAKNIRRQALSLGQIASLSGLKKRTVVNWFQEGHITKPRDWRKLIKLAVALELDRAEVDELLSAARHPSLGELRSRVKSKEDQDLLAPWPSLEPPFRAENMLGYFADREAVLADLTAVLTRPQPPALVSIEGMPGVGKTELAAILAHRLRTHFHDGVLWVDAASSDPLAKLGELASSLHHDLKRYEQLPDRSRAFKEILSKKKVLIILDGVTSDQEVDPFVPPPGSPSAVIVTTRFRDLWATRDAHTVYIEEFTDGDARELFINVLGRNRVVTEQQALQALASYAGNLPIALDITAHWLKRNANRTGSDYLESIEESEERLLQLTLGRDRNIFNLFETSFEQLPPSQQRFFAALSVFVGPDFSVDAAAYVSGTTAARAKRFLNALVDASLLKETTQGRYRLHTLLRDYANVKLTDSEAETRMIRFYTAYAETHQLDIPLISLEIDNIRAALAGALFRGMDTVHIREFVGGVNGIYKYLQANGLFAEARLLLEQAVAVARQIPDPAAEARMITYLADLERISGNLQQAQRILETAIPLAEASQSVESLCAVYQGMGTIRAYLRDFSGAEVEYLRGLNIARNGRYIPGITSLIINLSAVRLYQGNWEDAANLLHEGLELARTSGARESESMILSNLASLEDRIGNTAAANDHLRQSLDLARYSNHRAMIINISANLAATEIEMGDYAGAAAHLLEALFQARELGDVEVLIRVLRNYGELYSETDNHIAADGHYTEALQIARAAQNDLLVMTILADWGEQLLTRGEYDRAQSHFEDVVDSASPDNFPEFRGIAQFGLAQIRQAKGEIDEPCSRAREALILFEKIGNPRAKKVASFLSESRCSEEPDTVR